MLPSCPLKIFYQAILCCCCYATKSLQSCLTLCVPIDGLLPDSSVPGFSRQEHWSGLPFPSPKRERTQTNKIRSEKGEATTDTREIQKIVRDYYKKLYAIKMHNVEEMDQFLERYNLSRLNQEVENMNRSITRTEVETDLKTPNKQKSRTRQSFLSNIQRRVNTYPSETILTHFRGTLPNSFQEATITLISKPEKYMIKKQKLQASITDEHRDQSPQ